MSMLGKAQTANAIAHWRAWLCPCQSWLLNRWAMPHQLPRSSQMVFKPGYLPLPGCMPGGQVLAQHTMKSCKGV